VIQNCLLQTEKVERFARVFYIKRKEGERELDSGETERECVCVRAAEHCSKRKIMSSIKLTVDQNM
jgi:hypothetical protein